VIEQKKDLTTMRLNRLPRLFVSMVVIVSGWTTAHAAPDGPPVIAPKYEVRIERHVMIPMRDATKLSADMVRPAAEGRFPVVFHYDPYRRSGLGWDIYLAKRGFVSLKLDARGTGGSEGNNTDEYMPIEQQDGYDAVEWLAQQPWSNGNVGMMVGLNALPPYPEMDRLDWTEMWSCDWRRMNRTSCSG
jgi:predicted acyl esterase